MGIGKESIIHLGQKVEHLSNETKQKISQSNKGKHNYPMPERVKQKLLLSHIGKPQSLETIQKRILKLKGKPRSLEVRQKIRNSLKGRVMTEEARKKLSAGHKDKHPSEETKQKLSLINKGKTHCRIYQPHTEATKRKMSISQKAYRQTSEGKNNILKAQKAQKKASKPQKELFELLKQIFPDAQLDYLIKTKRSWRFADIGIPSFKFDFEYDGYFAHDWHTTKKDKCRDKELAEVGWVTFRISKDALLTLSKQPIFILKKMMVK